jgi:hypothetical protein
MDSFVHSPLMAITRFRRSTMVDMWPCLCIAQLQGRRPVYIDADTAPFLANMPESF